MKCCKEIPTQSIQITRGDDSNALGHYIKFVINTEIDLAGWYAIFQLQNFQWRYDDLTTGELFLNIPREISGGLDVGEQYGAMKIFDENGKCRTIVKNIPFFINKLVVNNPTEA